MAISAALNKCICGNSYLLIFDPKTLLFSAKSHFEVKFPSTTTPRIRYCGYKFPLSVLETGDNKNFELSFENFRNWWNLDDSNEPESSSNKKNSITVSEALLEMWELLGNEKWILFAAFGSLITAAISEITMPSILAESVFSAQNCQAMAFSRKAHFLGFLCLISGISTGLRSVCFSIANMILVKRLRETLYSALIFQDIKFFDSQEVGGLTSRLGSDCQRLSHVIGNDIHLIVRNILQGTGAMINLLCLSWPLALSAIIVCCILAALFLVYGWYRKIAARLTQDFTAHANEAADETLSMIRTVHIYGTERKECGRYKHWLDKLAFISIRESAAHGLVSLSFHSLYRATQTFAVLLGGMSIMAGHLSAEQLTKYILYCEWLIYATWRVVDNMSSLLQAIGASEKVFQLMKLSPSNQFLSKGVKLQRLTGQIHFVDVTFNYPSRPIAPILEHFHISIEANEVVALVGLSGSGKTTIVNLLLRLYEPSNGQIYIDGFPLGQLDMSWLKESIGYVGQEPQLFRTDVKSNITYGCHWDVKLEDVKCAAKQAYAHEFISSLPEGYETLVDDELLSGGQKQRIAIARAILRNPAILILDEATSALDAKSEHYFKGILDAFKNEDKTRRTVIIIAHRLSTIKAADRIIVIDGGRVVETGNHVELLLKDGLYSHLIKLQSDVLA